MLPPPPWKNAQESHRRLRSSPLEYLIGAHSVLNPDSYPRVCNYIVTSIIVSIVHIKLTTVQPLHTKLHSFPISMHAFMRLNPPWHELLSLKFQVTNFGYTQGDIRVNGYILGESDVSRCIHCPILDHLTIIELAINYIIHEEFIYVIHGDSLHHSWGIHYTIHGDSVRHSCGIHYVHSWGFIMPFMGN